jgi:hypothetical protein
MSALQRRLVVAQQQSVRPDTDAVALPFDCICAYLDAHPLVAALSTAKEVHSALVRLERERRRAADDAPDTPAPATRPYDCVECDAGYVFLDAQGGVHVCEACGAVQTHSCINVTPEWMAPVTDADLAPRHRRRHYVPGVPQWMMRRHDGGFASKRESMDLMHTLNAHVQLCDDDLERVHQRFRKWNDNGYTRETKMVACMIHPLLRDQFIDERELRTCLRTHRGLPEVVDPTPRPTFPCVVCKTLQHTAQSARFHCRGAKLVTKRTVVKRAGALRDELRRTR